MRRIKKYLGRRDSVSMRRSVLDQVSRPEHHLMMRQNTEKTARGATINMIVIPLFIH